MKITYKKAFNKKFRDNMYQLLNKNLINWNKPFNNNYIDAAIKNLNYKVIQNPKHKINNIDFQNQIIYINPHKNNTTKRYEKAYAIGSIIYHLALNHSQFKKNILLVNEIHFSCSFANQFLMPKPIIKLLIEDGLTTFGWKNKPINEQQFNSLINLVAIQLNVKTKTLEYRINDLELFIEHPKY